VIAVDDMEEPTDLEDRLEGLLAEVDEKQPVGPIIHCPACSIERGVPIPRWPCPHIRFSAVMADPPWPYDAPRALVGNGGRGSDGGRAAEIIQVDVNAHYETMTVDQIKKLPVAPFMLDNSLLFLWTTNAFLADGQAADVVRAWGFKPKTVITWAKTKAGTDQPSMKTGHWFRGASEHIIVGARGAPKRPEGMPALPTWQPHPRLAHSVKPGMFYDIVEKVSGGPYLELFARRPGRNSQWAVWGNEIDSTFNFGK
jgi:N6-adenosine-specific RNA methylase IME4